MPRVRRQHTQEFKTFKIGIITVPISQGCPRLWIITTKRDSNVTRESIIDRIQEFTSLWRPPDFIRNQCVSFININAEVSENIGSLRSFSIKGNIERKPNILRHLLDSNFNFIDNDTIWIKETLSNDFRNRHIAPPEFMPKPITGLRIPSPAYIKNEIKIATTKLENEILLRQIRNRTNEILYNRSHTPYENIMEITTRLSIINPKIIMNDELRSEVSQLSTNEQMTVTTSSEPTQSGEHPNNIVTIPRRARR